MREYEIPVFIINGFLDSGKTSFIKSVIEQNQFREFKRMLMILCEEGEVECEPSLLEENNITAVTMEESEFDEKHLNELVHVYQPWAVIIEYNPMWKSIKVDESVLPKNWEVYQLITIINAATFEIYRNNMKSQISETLKDVDLVLFNRCREDMNLSSYRRSARALSSGVQVILEREDGEIMPLEEQLPYDLKDSIIQLNDEDFGIFYMDAMKRPEAYDGKTVVLTALATTLRREESDWCAVGRQFMTCCADDTKFFGFILFYPGAGMIEDGSWVRVEAKIKSEYRREYRQDGPVLYADKVSSAHAPEEEMIYL